MRTIYAYNPLIATITTLTTPLVLQEHQEMKFLWKKLVITSFVTVLSLFAASFMGIATVGAADHGQLVVEVPRRDVPVVLDGAVHAHAQIGNRIFVGGEFQQVQRPDGNTIDQPNIFAYDINTGLLDESFLPAVDGGVFALEVNPRGDALYVGGRFIKWDDSFVGRIVKLNAFGDLDISFQATASALVRDLAVTNEDVYLAGNFIFVGSEFRSGFAAVDANTGAVDPGFIMNVEDSAAEAQLGRGIVVTNDGNNVFGLHFGSRINDTLHGNQAIREVLVKIDTSGDEAVIANDWRVDWSGQTPIRDCRANMRDIAIAPDDSFVVIGGQGADHPPNCDSVLRYSTAGTGTADTDVIGFDWSARFYSSIFSVAVSESAVYVGGHFCAAPLNGADPESRQTHKITNQARAQRCNVNDPFDLENPSVIFPNDAVFRNQLAALDPLDGSALPWDPGSNALLGTFDLTVTDRGLLAGMDNNRYSQILTGRSGFFDFGGFTNPPPAPVVASCEVELINNVPVLSYSNFPNGTDVNILRNDRWVVTLRDTTGAGTYDDTSAVPGESLSYVVRTRPGGVVNNLVCSSETITIVDVAAEEAAVAAADAAAVAAAEAAEAAEAAALAAVEAASAAEAAEAAATAATAAVEAAEAEAAAATAVVAAAEAAAAANAAAAASAEAADAAERAGTAVAALASAAAEVSAADAAAAADAAEVSAVEAELSVVEADAVAAEAAAADAAAADAAKMCSVSVNANDVPVVSYSGFTNVSNVQFRRDDGINDRWIGSGDPGAGDFDDTSAEPGVAYSYVVRSRPDGVLTDVDCSPDPFTF